MELADSVIAWLRVSAEPRSFGDVHRMLEGRNPTVTSAEVKGIMAKLTRRRFAASIGKGLYKIGPRYASPSEALPSTTFEMPPLSERYGLLIDEVVRMGGSCTITGLFERLKARKIVERYHAVAEMVTLGVSRGDLRKLERGHYTLSRPARMTAPEAPALPESAAAPDMPDAPPPEAPIPTPSDDEVRLSGLIAAKRERLEALVTERDEYRRVQAHLESLLAHNLDSLRKTEQEIEDLEQLRQLSTRIRTALDG